MAHDEPRSGKPLSGEANSEASGEASSQPASSESMVDTRGVDWAHVRPDYVEGDWSLERIAAKHGTTETTLRMRAKRHGWVRLVGTKRVLTAGGPRSRGTAPSKAQEIRRKRMLARMFQVLDVKMSELEARMTQAMGNDGRGAAPQSAADAERDARSLNALARLYAKLVELDDAASGGAPETLTKDGDDAERLRRDLADRLARLSGAGDT